MKILIAVDGSDYSSKAIEFIAARRALIWTTPEIEVLNVQLPLPATWGAALRSTVFPLSKRVRLLSRLPVASPPAADRAGITPG